MQKKLEKKLVKWNSCAWIFSNQLKMTGLGEVHSFHLYLNTQMFFSYLHFVVTKQTNLETEKISIKAKWGYQWLENAEVLSTIVWVIRWDKRFKLWLTVESSVANFLLKCFLDNVISKRNEHSKVQQLLIIARGIDETFLTSSSSFRQ